MGKDYLYTEKEEARLRGIVDKLTSSDYIKEITSYNIEFIIHLAKGTLKATIPEEELKSWIYAYNEPKFRDTKSYLIDEFGATSLLQIADILLISENQNYKYKLFNKKTSQSVREELRRSDVYLRLVKACEENETEAQQLKGFLLDMHEKHGISKSFIEKKRKEFHYENQELFPIAKLTKNKRKILFVANQHEKNSLTCGHFYFYESDKLVEIGDYLKLADEGIREHSDKKTLEFLTKSVEEIKSDY